MPKAVKKPRQETEVKGIVKSVDKALTVLETLTYAEEPGLTLEEVSERTGVSRVTTWRLLTTLKRRGFVKYDALAHNYLLGRALLEIGAAAYGRFDLIDKARPILQELAEATGETANFGLLLEDGEMMFMEQYRSANMVHATPAIGRRLPLHCTSAGKAILAFLPREEVERIIQEKGLRPLTDKTITSLNRLEKELAEVRARGYAIDDEETEKGGTCIGAPIKDHEGNPIAAISITAPSNRLVKARFDEVGVLVLNAAQKLSKGGRH